MTPPSFRRWCLNFKSLRHQSWRREGAQIKTLLFRGSASHLRCPIVKIFILFAQGGNNLELVIYTKPDCPYCQQARDYYNSQGIAFTDYDAQNDRARREEMLSFSGGDPTVPCIVEDGKYKGSGWGDPPRG